MSLGRPIAVVFFRTEAGNEPVREWLRSLSKEERKIIGEDILEVQFRWPVGKPLVDHLGEQIWEIRSRLQNTIARVFFTFYEGKMVLLHGFIKKTQKTPRHELEIARRRKAQL